MSLHPINLFLRFILELIVLLAVGHWGWQMSITWYRYLLTLICPIILATIWGVFAVPGDPSRSGKAPVPIPGMARLFIEATYFALGSLAIYDLGKSTEALLFICVTCFHYIISYDRIFWLIKNKR